MENKTNNIIGSIIKVAGSNVIRLVAGVLVGLLLPKVIGVEDYGYYKTFTLYAGYVGLFHFGLIDGIYLKYGGCDYSNLNKDQFKVYSRTIIILESIISLLLIAISFLLNDNQRFIAICISFFLLVNNVTYYYQMVSQITRRFDELSKRNVIQSCLTCFLVVGIWMFSKRSIIPISYTVYMVGFVLINSFLSVWYIVTYRDITYGKVTSYSFFKADFFNLIKTGFPLMIANLCSGLILSIDRQIVNVLFDINTYAIYAFAYNLLSLFTTATSAISAVLYPTLKRSTDEKLRKMYTNLVSLLLVAVFAIIFLYYPLSIFVRHYLPQYFDSIIIFRVILPGLAISSAITVIIHNYFKAIGKSSTYFIISIIILLLSTLLNILAVTFLKFPIYVSVASIIVMLVWFCICDGYIERYCGYKDKTNYAYIIAMLIVFYSATQIHSMILSSVLYILMFLLVTLIIYRTRLRELATLLKQML